MSPEMTPEIAASSAPLLRVNGLERAYPRPRTSLWHAAEPLQALRGVSFELAAGQSLGVVGESGSGKSTLARLIMALDRPNAGSVELLGRNLHQLGDCELRAAVIFKWCSRTLRIAGPTHDRGSHSCRALDHPA